MVTLDAAVAKLRVSGDWSCEAGSQWSDADLADYEAQTGLRVPDQLRAVLKTCGWNGFDTHPERYGSFAARWPDGSRSVHETQVLVCSRRHFETMRALFTTGSPWPDQFTPPMVFFGTADGGHAYLLMDGTDRANNAVYVWERATDPYGMGDNARGVATVADTLYDFLHDLTSRDAL